MNREGRRIVRGAIIVLSLVAVFVIIPACVLVSITILTGSTLLGLIAMGASFWLLNWFVTGPGAEAVVKPQ